MFYAVGLLEFVSIDRLRPLLMTTSGSQHVFIVTGRYLKLIEAVSAEKIISTHLALYSSTI